MADRIVAGRIAAGRIAAAVDRTGLVAAGRIAAAVDRTGLVAVDQTAGSARPVGQRSAVGVAALESQLHTGPGIAAHPGRPLEAEPESALRWGGPQGDTNGHQKLATSRRLRVENSWGYPSEGCATASLETRCTLRIAQLLPQSGTGNSQTYKPTKAVT